MAVTTAASAFAFGLMTVPVGAAGSAASTATEPVPTGEAALGASGGAITQQAQNDTVPLSLNVDALPAGYLVSAPEVVEVPGPADGMIRFETLRLHDATAPSDVTEPAPSPVVFVELVRSDSQFPAQPRQDELAEVHGQDVAVYDLGERLEVRWLLSDHSAVSVISTEGSLDEAVGVAHAIASELLPTTDWDELATLGGDVPQVSLAAAALPGDPGGTDTNMNGTGSIYYDDWGSADRANRTICAGCTVNQGNQVAVWQAVLWSEGTRSPPECSTCIRYRMTNCNVDGVFGEKTKQVTRGYQYEQYGFTFGSHVDGVVGSNTWGQADRNLRATASGLIASNGGVHTLYFTRSNPSRSYGGNLNYGWSWNSSPYYYTGYSRMYLQRSYTNCVF